MSQCVPPFLNSNEKYAPKDNQTAPLDSPFTKKDGHSTADNPYTNKEQNTTAKQSPFSIKQSYTSPELEKYSPKDISFTQKDEQYNDICIDDTIKLFQNGDRFSFQSDKQYIFNA